MDQRLSSFDFLDRLDPELANLGKLAESYFQDDPSTSLIKLRQFGERMTRRHAALVGSDVQDGETQADVVRRHQYERTVVRRLPPPAVHPRVGGEQTSISPQVTISTGSSPRGRGTDFRAAPRSCPDRFIPAWAGNSMQRRPKCAGRSVHPRVGGEQFIETMGYKLEDGSSPRGRGTAFWP